MERRAVIIARKYPGGDEEVLSNISVSYSREDKTYVPEKFARVLSSSDDSDMFGPSGFFRN